MINFLKSLCARTWSIFFESIPIKLTISVKSIRTVLFSPGFGLVHVGNNDSDAAASERVSIDQGLGDERRKAKDVLDFLRCDVLALRQLEDVL
jgi:hypothetical protein